MSVTTDDLAGTDQGSRLERYLLGDAADERRHRRIVISLPVRFLFGEGTEHRGLLFDMSPGGVSITSDLSPPIDARVVLYIDDVGRVEGSVSRCHTYGFSVALATTQLRRDKIAERLTLYANRHRLRADDLRAHERVETDQKTQCVMPDGSAIHCRVLDLSLTGAAIEIAPPPSVGTEIALGKMRGIVVRHIEGGIGVKFLDPASHASARSRLSAL